MSLAGRNIHSVKVGTTLNLERFPRRFSNPLGHGVLPKTFSAESWVRPNEYKQDCEFVIYEGTVESTVDLLNLNKHLLKSPLMRAIICSISNLLRLAYKMPFEVEADNQLFVPTFDRIWQPWHHIYSMCKAGKGQIHNPVLNPNGKYIVRLFYMGAWRKIILDDYLPLDLNGSLLLPRSKENELWLPMLSKALILIGSLSWTDTSEIIDFNVITCLTGWTNYTINNCQEMEPRYIWTLCQKLLMANQEDESLRYGGMFKQHATHNYSSVGVSPKNNDVANDSNTLGEHEVLGPVVMFGDLSDLSEYSDVIQGISPCIQHLIMITEAKIIKHNYDPDRPPTPLWKKFRWKAWAIRKGIIKDLPMYESQSIRVFSYMKNFSISDNKTEYMALEISALNDQLTDENSVEKPTVFEEVQDQQNVNKTKNKNKKSLLSETKSKKSSTDKRSKTSEKKKSKVPKINIVQLSETPEELDMNEPWFDIEKVMPILRCIEVYIRPSCFEHNVTFTAVSQLGLTKIEKTTTSKRSQGAEREINPNIRKCKRDCFYLFLDSPYSKKIFLTLCALPEYKEIEYLDKINKYLKDNTCEEQNENLKNENISYHILGEDYNWKNMQTGKEVFSYSTRGTSSTMLQLEEGISVIRVWLKTPSHYSLQILSQIQFLASSVEEIQEQLVGYSSSLVYYGDKILTAFVALNKTISESEDRVVALQTFKTTYLPPRSPTYHIHENSIMKIDNIFEEAILLTLRDQILENEHFRSIIVELQTLLDNPSLGSNILQEIEENNDPVSAQSSSKENDNVKNVKKDSTPKKSPKRTSKKESKKEETISNMNTQRSAINVFNIDTFIKTLFHMVKIDESLLQYYPFSKDLDKMLEWTDYKGSQQISPTQDWLPLLRFVVNFHAIQSVLCGFNFDSSIQNYSFRVIDNDNLKEIPYGLIHVTPTYYCRNNKGYTLLAYGNVNGVKEPGAWWKLRILAEKKEYLPHACNSLDNADCTIMQPPKFSLYELRDYYIPNRHKNICRCILKTNSSLSLTLRLNLSYTMVEFILMISRKLNNVEYFEYYGRGELIVPVVELLVDNSENLDDPAEFEIEVYVLKKDGWPLSPEERLLVNQAKERKNSTSSSEIPKPMRQKSAKKISSGFIQHEKSLNIASGAPYWTLQVVTVLEMSRNISLDIDRQQEENIRKLKSSWEEGDPGRRERAMHIRDAYLRDHPDSLKQITDLKTWEQSSTDMRQNSLFSDYFDCALDLNNYILLDDCLGRREEELKTEFDTFSFAYKRFNSGRKRILEEQLIRSRMIGEWYDTTGKQSMEIMQKAYDARSEYLHNETEILEQQNKETSAQKKELKKGKNKKENKQNKTKKASKRGKK